MFDLNGFTYDHLDGDDTGKHSGMSMRIDNPNALYAIVWIC